MDVLACETGDSESFALRYFAGTVLFMVPAGAIGLNKSPEHNGY